MGVGVGVGVGSWEGVGVGVAARLCAGLLGVGVGVGVGVEVADRVVEGWGRAGDAALVEAAVGCGSWASSSRAARMMRVAVALEIEPFAWALRVSLIKVVNLVRATAYRPPSRAESTWTSVVLSDGTRDPALSTAFEPQPLTKQARAANATRLRRAITAPVRSRRRGGG
ncbi:MAG: hypothetical protein ACJ72O_03880 [Marmoricola sp.]